MFFAYLTTSGPSLTRVLILSPRTRSNGSCSFECITGCITRYLLAEGVPCRVCSFLVLAYTRENTQAIHDLQERVQPGLAWWTGKHTVSSPARAGVPMTHGGHQRNATLPLAEACVLDSFFHVVPPVFDVFLGPSTVLRTPIM